MTDDVKAAVEWLRRCVEASTTRRDGIYTVVGLPPCSCERCADNLALLAHINGEPARTAAAVAAAREEQREACALNFPKPAGESLADPWASALVRATPLTATPLADELRDEREVSQSLREQLIAAEAERDALRARAGNYETILKDLNERLTLAEALVDRLRTDLANADAAYAGDVSAQRVRAERAEAQAVAARAWVTQRVGVEGLNDMLAETAMDGAKP